MTKGISIQKSSFNLWNRSCRSSVRRLNPMLEFYQDVLGCKLVRSNEKLGLYHLSAGASMIDLIPVDAELGRKGGAPPGLEGHNVTHCFENYPFDENN